MKKTIIALVLATAFVGVQTQSAKARDCNVGAVLGGVAAGVVIANAFQPHTVYYSQPAPVYYAQPAPVQWVIPPRPVCAPPRVVYYQQPVVSFQFGRGHGHGHGGGHRQHHRSHWR